MLRVTSNLVLVRQAPRRSEIRKRKLVTLARRVPRLAKLTAVLTTICVLFGVVVCPRSLGRMEQSKTDVTRIVLKKYAYEAYPSWLAAHRDGVCPRSLHELADYMNADSDRDAWGKPLVFWCEGQRLMVTSAGEDARFGTEDDLKSWD